MVLGQRGGPTTLGLTFPYCADSGFKFDTMAEEFCLHTIGQRGMKKHARTHLCIPTTPLHLGENKLLKCWRAF